MKNLSNHRGEGEEKGIRLLSLSIGMVRVEEHGDIPKKFIHTILSFNPIGVESVSVNIYNSEYKLRGEEPDQIRAAATLVDQQMRSIASKVPMQPATTTAVLAALNTAEQLISERTTSTSQRLEVVEKLNELDALVRNMLDSP